MPARAVLRLDLEGAADITRTLGQIRGVARSAQSAMSAEARRGSADRKRAATDEGRAQAAAAQEATRARVRAEREASRTAQAEARRRAQGDKAAAQERIRAEKEVTRTQTQEARTRTRAATQEAREAARVATELGRTRERAEREHTRTVRREARARARAEVDAAGTARRVVRGGAAVGSAAASAGRAVHSDIQEARVRRAGVEHTLNAALYQAGVGSAEAAGMRRQVTDFARTQGMDPQALAEALGGAQTQFSVLAGGSVAERQQNLGQQLRLASFAQSTFQDPAEVMRVAGMLGQQGVRGADQAAMLHALTGMAQAGSIELGTLTSTALGPLMQNISRSVNPAMTAAERAAAVQRTTAQTMAVGELGSAAGLTPRDSLNALSKMRQGLTSDVTAERLRGRLRHAGPQGTALAGQLFDRQGRMTVRDPVELMSRLVAGFGGDANRVSNLLAAGGPGAPMVMDAQQRRLITALAGQARPGETIQQAVERMQGQGGAFGAADVARGAALVQGEQATRLTREQAQHDDALVGNTTAINTLSNSFQTWTQQNPIGAAAVGAGAGLVPAAAAANPAATVGALAAGATFANTSAILRGRTVGGERVGGVERFMRAGLGTIPLVGPAIAASLGVRDTARAAVGTATGRAVPQDAVGAILGLPDRIVAAITRGVTVTLDPHTAAHAASSTASGRSPPPPEAR